MRVLLVAAASLALAPFAKADAITLDYFGICAGPMNRSGGDYLAECDEIIASGVKWVRLGPSWNRIEKSKGVYDTAYLAKCDEVINRFHANGVNVLWILSFTAPWASSQPVDPKAAFYKPANWADWEDFVTFVCNRYAGKVSHWEVWNEQDSDTFWKSSAADYAVLLQKASAKVRLADSGNVVLIGGFTGGGANYLGSLFAADPNLGSYFDVMNYHGYVDSPNLVARYQQFTGVMGAKGIADKPIWITETGCTTYGDPASEAAKADWVDQTRVTHFSMPGIERIFWYNYRNAVPNGNPKEENFGLETSDRTPLDAYYHYQGGDCAETNFALQKAYPTQAAARLALTFVDATSGGAVVEDYVHPDGSFNKRIPVGHYLVCRIKDAYIYGNNYGLDASVTIEVDYWDEGTPAWQFQYQTASTTVQTLTFNRTNTLQWKTRSFTITDHEFKNEQSWAADFRIFAGSYTPLIVKAVRVHREMNPGRVILGSTNRVKLVEHIVDTDPASAAYTTVETIGGRECRMIANAGKYFYFKVCDGLVRTKDTDVTVGIRFYDAGTGNIVVQYLSTTSGSTYVNAPIAKTNTHQWRYATVHLTNAKFDNSKSWGADFRIYSGTDNSPEYVDRVDVTRN